MDTDDTMRLEQVTRDWVAATAGVAADCSFNDFTQPDTVWMVGLLASHEQLLHTAARLFMHLRSQYDRKNRRILDDLDVLRGVHEQELAIMLGMTDSGGRDVVVNSHTTQAVFERHSRELANAEREGERQLGLTVRELRENFLSFFCVAAPDVIGAAQEGSEAAEFCRTAPQLRCPVWHGRPGAQSVITTIRVVNPLRGRFVGARPKDPSLSGIVMDIAPLSLLAECLPLGRASDDGTNASDEAALKVSLSLKRLATNRNHTLWIVGDHHDRRSLLNGNDEPELMMDSRPGWQPCGGHSHEASSSSASALFMKCSTSVWGGNFLFHWDPAEHHDEAARVDLEAQHVRWVVHHAVAWNVDGLSVAFGPSCSAATVGRVMIALNDEIANVQMDCNCSRAQHAWSMNYTAVRRLLPDFGAAFGPVPTASGRAVFNLAFGVTVFAVEDGAKLAQRIFEGDAEVVLPATQPQDAKSPP
jgi:hypothetical protein